MRNRKMEFLALTAIISPILEKIKKNLNFIPLFQHHFSFPPELPNFIGLNEFLICS